MRCVAHRTETPSCHDQSAHVAKDIGPGLDVEAHGRLVEHEQPRMMQQGAGDLDAPHLAAGQIAHLVVRAVRERNTGEHVSSARPALLRADTVQRRVVGQVLDDREIEVESARLEHHPDHAQRFTRGAFDVMAENPDPTALDRVEARHQREQRALSGSVEPQENCEGRGRDREADVIESLASAVAMAHALDRDRGRLDGAHSVHYDPRRW